MEQVDFDDPDSQERCMDDLILKAMIWQDDHWVNRSALLKVEQSSEQLKGAAKVVLLSLDRNRELSLFSFPFTSLIEGVIHQYKPSEHEHEGWTKVKHVPPAFVEAYFEGCWRDVVCWRHASTGSTSTCAAAGSSSSGRGGSSS